MKGLNLSSFRKIKEDKDSATMQHKDGHTLMIAKGSLPHAQRKQLEKLPVHKMAEGGDVTSDIISAPIPGGPPTQDAAMDTQSQPDAGAGRSPASIGSYLGDAFHNAINSTEAAVKNVAGPIISNTGDFVHSALGQSVPAANASENGAAPSASKSLPDMGKPIGDAPANNRVPESLPESAVPGVSLKGAYSTGIAGIKAQQEAESGLGKSNYTASHDYRNDLENEQKNWNQRQVALTDEINNSIQDVKKGAIQPNHYLENMSTGSKIGTAIGLILGGASSVTTGKNPGLDYLNNQIDRDIAAQKQNQNNNATILGAYQQKFQNGIAAENMARATQNAIYAAKLQEAAATAATPEAKARALQASAALQEKILPLVTQANAINMLQNRQKQKAANPQAFAQTPVDYPALNILTKAGIAPQQDVEAATKEAGKVAEARNLRSEYIDSYNQLNRKFLAGSATPADRAAYVNVLGAKLSKMATNRYNAQENQQLVEGMFPSAADADKTRHDKLSQGLKYFESLETDTPTLDRYGLKNPIPQQPAAKASHAVGDVIYYKGQKMQIIDKAGNLKPVS